METPYRFVAAVSHLLIVYCLCMPVSHAMGQSPTDYSPAESRRLLQKIKVDFDDQPLNEVLQTLASHAGLKMVISNKHLAAEGVTSDTPVSIKLTQELSVRSTLNLILQDLNLAYKVQNGALHIISATNCQEFEAQFYLARRFGMSPQESVEFLKRIRRTVSPHSWRANGGSMWLRLSDNADVLSMFGTQELHQEIHDLLQTFANAHWRALQASKEAALATTERRSPRGAAELKLTDVLPHAMGDIRRGRNYVYQIATQLAWNQLRKHVDEPIKLQRSPPLAAILNRSDFKSTDVSNESHVAAAGTISDGVVESIHREMKEKFPRKQIDLPRTTDEDALLLYAYLYKRMAFKDDFERLVKPLAFQTRDGVRNVASFGIAKVASPEPLVMQVVIHDYRSDDDFIIELKTKSETDELILAKVAPSKTLSATIKVVRKRMGDSNSRIYLRDDDSLIVPILDLHVASRSDELLGRPLLNNGWKGRYLASAQAIVRFRLDEMGVTLESLNPVGRSLDKPKPRNLVFDKPFLIFMKQRKADAPYFVMWVENDEIMENFTHPK